MSDSNEERAFPEEADFVRDAIPGCGLFPCFGVTDEAGRLVKEYTPTRNELGVLARHYLTEIYKWEELSFLWGQVDSHGRRFEVFASRRLDRIGRLLGKETMDELLGEMRKRRDAFIRDGRDLAHRRGVNELADLDPDDLELRAFIQSHPW
jgi:hypothetical protein